MSSGRLATLPEEAGSETGDHRPGSVTVHDSCYLARYNNIIAAPRDVLGAAGVSITEMEKSGKNTFCCGAGGGRMWMEETRGTRINENRTAQVLATGAETVATCCPFCMVMMSDGLAAAPRRDGGQRHGHQRGPGGADRVGAGGAAVAVLYSGERTLWDRLVMWSARPVEAAHDRHLVFLAITCPRQRERLIRALALVVVDGNGEAVRRAERNALAPK